MGGGPVTGLGPLDGIDVSTILSYVQTVLSLGGGMLGVVIGISAGIILFGLVVRRIVGGIRSAAGLSKGGKPDGYAD
jgi:hypothetical protein